jgi:hypothetical protein
VFRKLRLADAGFAADEIQPAVTETDGIEGGAELSQLAFAADERVARRLAGQPRVRHLRVRGRVLHDVAPLPARDPHGIIAQAASFRQPATAPHVSECPTSG